MPDAGAAVRALGGTPSDLKIIRGAGNGGSLNRREVIKPNGKGAIYSAIVGDLVVRRQRRPLEPVLPASLESLRLVEYQLQP